MRKVTVEIKFKVEMTVDEGVEIDEIINEMEYSLNDTTTKADFTDTQMLDFEVTDSR